jgi:hypothetical protein
MGSSFLGFFLNDIISDGEMNMMKVALAAHILVETKGEKAGAIKTLTGWGKQYASNLPVPEGWCSREVGLLAYLVMYNKQV